MALTAQQISDLTAIRNGRESEVAIVTQIQEELAQICKLMVPLSVAHSRTKLYWADGEDVSIFRSEADGKRVNGWYCSTVGTEPVIPESPHKIVATFGVQHLYEYAFGSNANNSERQFNENWSAFLAAFERSGGIKTLAGKQFLGHSSSAGITERTKPPCHFFNAQLRFRICDL